MRQPRHLVPGLSLALALASTAALPTQDRPVEVRAIGPARIAEVETSRGPVNVAWTAFGDGRVVFDPAFPEGLQALRGPLGAATARDHVVALGHGADGPQDPPLADWFEGTVIQARPASSAHPASLEVDGQLTLRRGAAMLELQSAGGLAAPGPGLVAWLRAPGLLFPGPLGQLPDGLQGAPDAGGWRRWADGWTTRSASPLTVVPLRGRVQPASWLGRLRDALDAALVAEQSAASRLGSLRGARVALEFDPEDPPALRVLMRGIDDALRARLQDVAPHVTIVEATDREQARRHAADVHAADAVFCDADFLAAAPQLRWIQAWSAGVERYLAIDPLRESEQLVLTNMRAMSGAPIADHAFGMLLALTRSLHQHQAAQSRSSWDRGVGRIHEELAGRTLVVLGLGGIGTACAERGAGFGMRVLATDVRLEPRPPFVEQIVPPDQLDSILPEADVVMVCLPLTDRTRNLLDARRLALLPQGALLINVARGRIVDTGALLQALESGQLAGAGLDVTEPEPLPEDHPLWRRADVVITPHVAGRSQGTDQREADLFAENLRRFAHAEPLLNVVDKQAGY